MITLSWLLVITVLAAALALIDGIRRLRSNHSNSILAIAELLFAALMLISIFIPFPAPLGTFVFAVALEVVLLLLLVIPGSRGRGFTLLTLIALVLNTIVVLIASGWLTIPGLG